MEHPPLALGPESSLLRALEEGIKDTSVEQGLTPALPVWRDYPEAMEKEDFWVYLVPPPAEACPAPACPKLDTCQRFALSQFRVPGITK